MNAATLPSLPVSDLSHRANPTAVPLAKSGVGERGTNGDIGLERLLKPPQQNRRRTWKRILIVGLTFLVLTGAVKMAHGWWTVGRFMESTDDAYVGGDVTVVAPKVAGFISQLLVGDNQIVHAGDLLMKLDDRDYLAALARTEASVALQQASLVNLDATRHLQEAVVAQAQAEITSAEAELSRSQDDKVRYQKLSENGVLSVQDFQRVDTDYRKALASNQKAHAVLDAAQRQLEVIGTQKLQVQAALHQAIADRDLARLNLSYTELRAPIDGVVGNRSAQTGAYASTGSQLISLVPTRGLWIDANFKESQLALVQPGSPAIVKIDSLPGRVFHGHVASIAPATGAQFSVLPPENATGNFTKIVQRITVRIVLDDHASLGQLRPGLSVVAEVDGRSSGKAAL